MGPATILRIHSIISAALDLAVRYEWTDRNAAKNARPPHPRKREPDPPSPEQAARLLNLVWAEDEEFGLYLWTALTTGARRGEVTALRENRFDFTQQQVRVSANYIVKQGTLIEKHPRQATGVSCRWTCSLVSCSASVSSVAVPRPPAMVSSCRKTLTHFPPTRRAGHRGTPRP